MTPEEIAAFAARLKTENPANEAYFGIFQYGGGPDESFIRANKQGLQLFAAQLLQAANQTDEVLAAEVQTLIPLEFEADWLDGDIFIQYVHPVVQAPVENTPTLVTQFDWPLAGSLLVVAAFLLIISVQEAYTLISRLFE